MKESKYVPVILESLNERSVSIGTLKKNCGQGKKITNIRKALHQLLREGLIEINGYDSGCKTFNYDCIMVKKVETNFNNPIYIKELLDNPLKNDNYSKIQEIFSKKIKMVNNIYNEELIKLNKLEGSMRLNKAIEEGNIKKDQIYREEFLDERYYDPEDPKYAKIGQQIIEENPQTGNSRIKHRIIVEDILKLDPKARIHFLKAPFTSQIAIHIIQEKFPYFGHYKKLNYCDEEYCYSDSFLRDYKIYLSHLPIDKVDEQILFNKFVIGALRGNSMYKNKEDLLWELATDLSNIEVYNFVEKLRVITYIKESEIDNLEHELKF